MRRVGVFVWLTLAALAWGQAIQTTIYEIQHERDSLGNSLWLDSLVTVHGIVTSDVGAVAGSRNFFLEMSQGGPWSGIMCWFQNPGQVVNLVEGDSVAVTGVVNEYFGNTEIIISNASDVQLFASGRPLPPVAFIPVGYLDTSATSMYDPDSAEAYEGVLVQVSNVFVSGINGPQGDWEVTDGTGFAYVRDNGNYTYQPQLGDQLSVRGIVRVYYDFFRISPRSDDDILPASAHLSIAYSRSRNLVDAIFTRGVEQASAENPANYEISGGVQVLDAQRDPQDPRVVHLATSDQQDGELYVLRVYNLQDTSGIPIPDGDSTTFYGGFVPISTIQSDTTDSATHSAWAGRRVTVTGIVTADSSGFPWYFLEEPTGGPWSGIQVYDLDHEPTMGDSIIIVGEVDEYFDMTEILNVIYFEVVSSGHPLPDPVVVPTGEVGEPYEGVLIRVENVIVTDPGTGGTWTVDDGSGPLLVANRSEYTYEPHAGDTLNITGLVRYTFGSYNLNPRGDADIEVVGVQVAESGGFRPEEIRLYPVTPSPAKGAMVLTFALPQRAEVTLSLYAPNGRKVRTLVQGPVAAGVHRLTVRPVDALGRPLPSGVYFYRLKVGETSRVQRFLLLRD